MERNRDEADWFMKMAWNLALQCGDNYKEMGDLFSACYKVRQLIFSLILQSDFRIMKVIVIIVPWNSTLKNVPPVN